MKKIHSIVVVVLMGVLTLCPAYTEMCEFDSCLFIYNNLMGLLEDSSTEASTLCELQQELKDCNKKLSRKCRGDLNYHFFEKLVRDLNLKIKNCSSHTTTTNTGSRPASHNHHHNNNNNNNGALSSNTSNKPGTSSSSSSSGGRRNYQDKCAPKFPADSSFVGCALYGLTNLKSYSQTLNNTDINYCSLSGAWNLIDTPEFAVQITNKGGLRPLPKDITTTTLVTVIIKSSQCSERKTYQATFDEVPGMFSDGSMSAGNVYIETMRESEHVKIHFPYLLATIDIIKVIDRLPIPSLSVTIRMPQRHVSNLLHDPSQLRGLSLCFYGCPKSATMRGRSIEPKTSICANYDSSASSAVSEFPSGNVEGNNAINSAICASFKSVQNLLSESTVVEKQLDFPGEENFGTSSSENPSVDRFNVENSALTSHGYCFFNKNGFPSLSLYMFMIIYFVVR